MAGSDEIAQARAVMDRMQLNEEQRREAIALFNRGKEADFPLDATVADFANTKHRKQLILVLLEILQVALADGQIDQAEEAILVRVAEAGSAACPVPAILNMLRAQFSGAGRAHRGGQGAGTPSRPSLGQAYQVLGVTESASGDQKGLSQADE